MSILGYLIQRKMRQELTTLQHSNCLAIMQKQMTNSNQLDFYEPTLQQVADLCSQFGFTCAGEADLACLRAILREGFSRYGHQPAPPVEGEVGELVADELVRRLRTKAATEKSNRCHYSAILLTRAADILERRHPEPGPELPADALAARPLLEKVARLGDVIGQQTVAQVQQLAEQAAVWLRDNPPGQPVAIEPRGCPMPGACACVEPALPLPTGEPNQGESNV